MTLVAPAAAEAVLLDYIVGGSAAGVGCVSTTSITGTGQVLHLYTSAIAPGSGTLLGTFQAADAEGVPGYTAQTLTYASWAISTASDNVTPPTAIYNPATPVTFSFTTGVSVWGYYVTDSTSTYLLWCEEFANAPFMMPSPGGGTIAIQPQLQLS